MEDKQSFIIFQPPNVYIWTMIVAWLAQHFTKEPVSAAAEAVFFTAATVWSYEEVAHGANWFRRVLGVVALVSVLISLFWIISLR